MSTIKLLEYKKEKKSTIDELINQIISGDDHSIKTVAKAPTKTGQKKWIMPEEPIGFIKCKKYDPL